MSLEKEVLETLKEIRDKWKLQLEKIPQLERQIAELSGLEEFRENTGKQLQSLTQKLDEFSKKAAQTPKAEAGHEFVNIRIPAPKFGLEHFETCNDCRPKLEMWLRSKGYERAEASPSIATEARTTTSKRRYPVLP